MNQNDLVPTLLSLVGKEVWFREHPGSTPIKGILTKNEGLGFFQIGEGADEVRFHYLEVDVLLANKVLGNKDTICRFIFEGFK